MVDLNTLDSDSRLQLRRLWKGTLYVAITGIYLTLILLTFIHFGWRPALLTVFLIALPQAFRYIASDVDRIGWRLETSEGTTPTEDTGKLQRHMLWLQFGLIQLMNLFLILQAASLAGPPRALATLIALVLVELLFARIRATNRQVAFDQASYGLDDAGLFPAPTRGRENRTEQLEARLEKLKTMADAGEISKKSYEKARDKHRVALVMETG